MRAEPVARPTADVELFRPADGLSLLGEEPGHAGRRFLVGRGDGEVVQLPLLLYLIMSAVAEGGVDGGWSADQVGDRVGAASGQRLTVDNVRYLITSKLAPLGLIAPGAADPPGAPAGAARPSRGPGAGPRIRGGLSRLRLPAGLAGRLRAARVPRRSWALVIGGAAVLATAAAVPPIMASSGSRAAGGTLAASRPAGAGPAGGNSQTQAAAWVAQQVSRNATVWCDPAMCRQLQGDGFPVARLKTLAGQDSELHQAGLVVATPAVRSELGAQRAAADAPQVIASFGAGAGRVDVRMIAPDGAAAFATTLAAEQRVLATAGRQLLGNKNLRVSPAARAALREGRVDARLLALLSLLSGQQPVQLTGFTGGPGAGPGVPLRGAELAVTSAADRSSVIALLQAQQSPYRPAVTESGPAVVALRFDAPASLILTQT